MSKKEEIESIVKTLDVAYGDTIKKSDLMELFGISTNYDSQNVIEYKEHYEDNQWAFLHCMEMFKAHMREHRHMHLVPQRKRNTYRIIRPDEHAAIALGHLKKQIEKGFSDCKKILESTAVDLLTSSEKLALANANVNSSRLESMFNRFDARSKRYHGVEEEGSKLLIQQ